MFEGFVDAGELLGGLGILLREMVEAAQLQTRENIGGIFRVRRVGGSGLRGIALRHARRPGPFRKTRWRASDRPVRSDRWPAGPRSHLRPRADRCPSAHSALPRGSASPGPRRRPGCCGRPWPRGPSDRPGRIAARPGQNRRAAERCVRRQNGPGPRCGRSRPRCGPCRPRRERASRRTRKPRGSQAARSAVRGEELPRSVWPASRRGSERCDRTVPSNECRSARA